MSCILLPGNLYTYVQDNPTGLLVSMRTFGENILQSSYGRHSPGTESLKDISEVSDEPLLVIEINRKLHPEVYYQAADSSKAGCAATGYH